MEGFALLHVELRQAFDTSKNFTYNKKYNVLGL